MCFSFCNVLDGICYLQNRMARDHFMTNNVILGYHLLAAPLMINRLC